MSVNISVSLKLTLIVIIVSSLLIFTLTGVFLQTQEEKRIADQKSLDLTYQDIQFEKVVSLMELFNLTFYNVNQINAIEEANEYIDIIDKFNRDYDNVVQISINLPDENYENLVVFVSTDNNSMNKTSNPYTFENGSANRLAYEEGDNYIVFSEDKTRITGISPINNTYGNIIGTYEITISNEKLDNPLRTNYMVGELIITSLISLFIIIFIFLYLLRKSIVKPIILLRDAARIFGKGDLDHKVELSSNDEIGELSSAFNQMAADLKESRDKIQDYNQILENLLKRKDEFIGQLGHDLKNPLQPLVGLLPMLIEQEKDPKIKETLIVMNKNVEYMRDLIFKTLQLAKLRSTNIKFDFEDLNLSKEANDVIESQKMMLKEHKIKIENKIKSSIVVKADKLRLAEVFKNLITNSVKYTKGGGKITINAKANKKFVTVSLTDTGIGMSKEQIKKVFDEFYKADKFSSEEHSSGLGLPICKRIVEKHGGKIWVDSPGPKKGSTFYFTLKLGGEK